MRYWLTALALIGGMAHAQSAWFTVMGDPLDKAADTVQVDPGAAMSTEPSQDMNLRVNRAAPRTDWDGVPYRSYESRVVFDCRTRKASYVVVRFYIQPLWQGEPHKIGDYSASPRPMLFTDMKQNPRARIVRAACRGTPAQASSGRGVSPVPRFPLA